MATPAQIAANRANAQKSTGPRTEEGKQRSSRNALRHGLAGHGVVLPEEMADAIQQRKDLWRSKFRPDDPHQEWLFERICIESVRADVCLHREIALTDELAHRASETWDEDRRLESEILVMGLSKRPEVVQRRLLQTKQGCDVLLSEWRVVEMMLGHPDGWTMMRDHALDLMGVPRQGREHRAPEDLGPGLALESARALAAGQVAALRRRQEDYLNDRDDRARSDAENGLAPPEAPSLRRLARYESEGQRRLRWLLKEYRAAQQGPAAAAARPESEAKTNAAESGIEAPARPPAPVSGPSQPRAASGPALAPAPASGPAAASGSAPAPSPSLGSGRTLSGLLRGQILGQANGTTAPIRRN